MFMSLIDVVLNRRSIRSYEPKEIPKDVLDKILEAGRQAPSAANQQPWHFIVLTDSEIKKELSKGMFNRFIKDAPVTIVGCAHNDLIAGCAASCAPSTPFRASAATSSSSCCRRSP